VFNNLLFYRVVIGAQYVPMLQNMPSRPITEQREKAIIVALNRDSHASRVAHDLGESYVTVWRVAEREGIDLTAGRAAKGYKRLPPERRAKVEDAAREHPEATQKQLARQAEVSLSTVRRVLRARREALAPAG
jgi:hypothetical protein